MWSGRCRSRLRCSKRESAGKRKAMRGARPGKPERQTAGASSRTPQEAPVRARRMASVPLQVQGLRRKSKAKKSKTRVRGAEKILQSRCSFRMTILVGSSENFDGQATGLGAGGNQGDEAGGFGADYGYGIGGGVDDGEDVAAGS